MNSSTFLLSLLVASSVLLNGCALFNRQSEAVAAIAQVPITDQPSGARFPGKIIWHDLVTTDVESAAKFYENLFGWQVDIQDTYSVIRNGSKPIAGILRTQTPDNSIQNGIWLPTASVADVDAAAQRATDFGGTILKGPLDMEHRGRALLLGDPSGANIVLLKAIGGDPVDPKIGVGDWLWDEVWTHDPDLTEEFYASVLEYDEVATPNEKYRILMHQSKWRTGIRHISDQYKQTVWIPVVRVASPTRTAKRVEVLGGKVLVKAEDAPTKGETALVADTTGAMFLIQRWPPLPPKEDK